MASRVAPLNTLPLQGEARIITAEPYYEAVAGEIALFEAAYASQLPVLLKGPTGSGKTRFIEHMAWRLKRLFPSWFVRRVAQLRQRQLARANPPPG